jgi:hypothetical protein
MTTLAAVLFSLLIPAQSAEELLEAVAASMKGAPAVALEAEVHIRIGATQVAQKAKVVLKRPNLARLELTGAGQDSLIVLDGACAVISPWELSGGLMSVLTRRESRALWTLLVRNRPDARIAIAAGWDLQSRTLRPVIGK